MATTSFATSELLDTTTTKRRMNNNQSKNLLLARELLMRLAQLAVLLIKFAAQVQRAATLEPPPLLFATNRVIINDF